MIKTKKEKDVHICSECIGKFSAKDIFTADVPNASLPHSTNYCIKCIKKLDIIEYKPYLKPRATKTTATKTKKGTTAKTKKGTTAKTKKGTTTKTKKNT